MVLVAELDPIHEDRTLTPGAKMSTTDPKLENEARLSLMSMAPTVMANGSEAGDLVEAWTFSFPAATTTVTPLAIVLRTAVFKEAEYAPPRDMLRTDLAGALFPTHWIPEMTPAVVPLPSAPKTLTATSLAAFATPYVEPPIVPAQ